MQRGAHQGAWSSKFERGPHRTKHVSNIVGNENDFFLAQFREVYAVYATSQCPANTHESSYISLFLGVVFESVWVNTSACEE